MGSFWFSMVLLKKTVARPKFDDEFKYAVKINLKTRKITSYGWDSPFSVSPMPCGSPLVARYWSLATQLCIDQQVVASCCWYGIVLTLVVECPSPTRDFSVFNINFDSRFEFLINFWPKNSFLSKIHGKPKTPHFSRFSFPILARFLPVKVDP